MREGEEAEGIEVGGEEGARAEGGGGADRLSVGKVHTVNPRRRAPVDGLASVSRALATARVQQGVAMCRRLHEIVRK